MEIEADPFISQKSTSNKDIGGTALKELKNLLIENGLIEKASAEILDVLVANNVNSITELAAFPMDKLPSLKLKPKGRSVLKVLIPKLNGLFNNANSKTSHILESFRLKELFSVLWYNATRDYEKTEKVLKEQLEIDSWSSFLELEEADLQEVDEIEPIVRQELLEVIEFANCVFEFATSTIFFANLTI
jgi:hypothetical protein